MRAKPITRGAWDFGGVLIDWNAEYLYRKMIPDEKERHFFLTQVCTLDWHYLHDAGVSFEENAQKLLPRYANDPRMQSLIRAWGERYDEMNRGPIQGAVDILTELCGAGIKNYGITNWPKGSWPPPKGRFPFLSLFEDIVVSSSEGVTKPNPKIFEILIERTGADPLHTFFVDDKQKNVDAAAEFGFTALLFTTPEALRSELIELGLPLSKRTQRCQPSSLPTTIIKT
jgi:2-haloacid dehalogenase